MNKEMINMDQQKRPDAFWKVFSVLLLVVLAGLIAAIVWHGMHKAVYMQGNTIKTSSQLAGLNPVPSGGNDGIYWIADLADKSLPFVVNIQTEVDTKKLEQLHQQQGIQDWQQLIPEPFRQQFQMPQDNSPQMMPQDLPPQMPLGEGSGFIVRQDGYIVTNAHVTENADKYKIRLNDGKEYDAKLIGLDSFKDIAVLKIDATGLPAAPLGNSDTVRIGEPVVAIGSPLGFEATVTSGIISTNKRKMEDLGRPTDARSPQNYLQTDAAINRGNSGGPLIDARGEVIGINQAIARWEQGQTEGGAVPIEGIGFAIPINDVKGSITAIIDTGKDVAYPGISATIASVKDYLDQNRDLKLAVDKGVYVVSLVVNGPAAKAGLKAGDVILSIDGTAVNSGQELIDQINTHQIGERVTLRVARQGGKHQEDVTVVLEKLDTSSIPTGE